jgi:CAAX protease family protein
MIGVPSTYRYPDETPPPEEPPTNELPRLGVPAWAPLVAILLALVGGALVAALIGSLIGIAGADDNANQIDAPDVALNIAFDAVLIAAPVVVVMWLAHGWPNPAAFGLRIPDWRQALKVMAAVYFAFWFAAGILGLAFGEPEDQSIVTELKREESLPLLAGIAVMTCVAAPLAEEFFFRGFLFRVLWERINVSVATVATGIVFGLVHAPDADWVGVAVLASFGAALCVLFWRTASLLPCIMLHAIHNSISFSYTKGLPWWGFLLLTAASVATTLAIALLAVRLTRGAAARPPVPV